MHACFGTSRATLTTSAFLEQERPAALSVGACKTWRHVMAWHFDGITITAHEWTSLSQWQTCMTNSLILCSNLLPSPPFPSLSLSQSLFLFFFLLISLLSLSLVLLYPVFPNVYTHALQLATLWPVCQPCPSQRLHRTAQNNEEGIFRTSTPSPTNAMLINFNAQLKLYLWIRT